MSDDVAELRLGTRGSELALSQSRWVQSVLEDAGGARVELEVIQTTGDRRQDRPLSEIGGKGLFTRELDRALLDGEIHLAVHSLKDLPTELDEGLSVAAIPEREDPRDVLVGPAGEGVSLAGLPRNARLGTSSLRRQALALAFRADLRVESIRGNLDTRLAKVDRGDYDAIVLAAAGLRRLGRPERIDEFLERTAWLPAPGQGALGIVTRSDDAATADLLEPLRHPPSTAAVRAERALLARLEGGCQIPIGALGIPYEGGLRLWGLVASPDGRHVVRTDRTGAMEKPDDLGREVAEILLERGAGDILDDIPDDALPGLTPP